MKLKKIFTRAVALFASAVIGMTTIATEIPASASTTGVNIGYTWNSSVNPRIKSGKSNSGSSYGISGQYLKSGEQICRFTPSTTTDWAFCIEPAKAMQGSQNGTWYTQYGFTEYDTFDVTDSNTADSTRYWSNFDTKFQIYLGLVQYYGYSSHKTGNYYAATQLILWEMILGYRGHTKETFSTCTDKLWNDFTYPSGGWCTQSGVESAYNDIVYNVTHHRDLAGDLKETATLSKADPAIMKFTTATMRYEATVTVPTSYVTAGSLSHNFSSLESALKKLTTDNFTGTYGTDYGVTSTVSNSNTVYTIWSKKRQFTTGTKTTDAIQLQTQSGISEQENLFASGTYQTCLISTRIDPVSAYVSIASYNEPNLTVEKTYQDSNGKALTGTSLTSALGQTKFVISTTIDGTTYYVKATQSGTTYVFSEYVTSTSSATLFTTQETTSNGKGTFTVNDLPTAETGGRKYTVSEYVVPSNGYTKKSASVTLPSPSADDYETNAGTSTVKLVNKEASADLGEVELEKDIVNTTTTLSDETLAGIYKDTYFVAGYYDTTDKQIYYFTNAYLNATSAVSGDLPNKSSYASYQTGDGAYYLPITYSTSGVDFNTSYLSTDIKKAYLFTTGYNTDSEYFGKIKLFFDTLTNKKATDVFFIEVSHFTGYGYTSELSNVYGQFGENASGNTLTTIMKTYTNLSKVQLTYKANGYSNLGSVNGVNLIPNMVYPTFIARGTSGSTSAEVDATNQRTTFSVKVTKKDSTTDETLAGAVFGLYRGNLTADNVTSKMPIETVTTGSDGTATFKTEVLTGTNYTVYERDILPHLKRWGLLPV